MKVYVKCWDTFVKLNRSQGFELELDHFVELEKIFFLNSHKTVRVH